MTIDVRAARDSGLVRDLWILTVLCAHMRPGKVLIALPVAFDEAATLQLLRFHSAFMQQSTRSSDVRDRLLMPEAIR